LQTKLKQERKKIKQLMGSIMETNYAVVDVTMATVYVAEARNICWWT